MGEGWVVMLDTLRRVDALLDRMSFLGASAGNRKMNVAKTAEIVNAMNTLTQYGVIEKLQEIDACEVSYSFNGFTIIVYWNGAGNYTCDINNHFGEEMYSSDNASIQTLVAWIKATLNMK